MDALTDCLAATVPVIKISGDNEVTKGNGYP
jgi:hypothetical protein